GFTDWMAARMLVRGDIWPFDLTVSQWNDLFYGYDTSPDRAVSNAHIVKDFSSNPDIQQIPYWRGTLLAAYWDWRLRETGDREGLDGVLREMRAHPHRTP